MHTLVCAGCDKLPMTRDYVVKSYEKALDSNKTVKLQLVNSYYLKVLLEDISK